jgi:HK97 family phage portal protein
MAWNKTETKSLGGSGGQVAHVGAPVAQNPGYAGKAYKDSWNIERAYKEGVRGVTWCFRACDAISANQAKLPMRLRLDNNPDGEIFKGKDPLLPILNSNASDTENAFAFRYRLSFQYLISTRGVFIEVMRNRAGEVTALGLLPPAYTAPIPDPKTFVSGYQIDIPGARSEVLQPNQVIWLRRPHPLDPYLSMTPLEAAGYAIESENLAKLYNRNFLLNDGRPGGLVVVNGQMDEDDKDELKARFRGNIARTGQVSVIASEGGAQFIDTAASPRDAAYIEMRDLSKDEILAAFGVPETVIGNASGRCLRASELVRLSDGTRVTAGSLVGKSFELMTSTPDGHVAVSAWATKEAIEPVYRITTETGQRPPPPLHRRVPHDQAGPLALRQRAEDQRRRVVAGHFPPHRPRAGQVGSRCAHVDHPRLHEQPHHGRGIRSRRSRRGRHHDRRR